MRTLRLCLVGTVILVVLGGGMSGAIVAQSNDESATDVVQQTLFEFSIPSQALPEDFVKLVVNRFTLEAGTDTSGDPSSILGNEALRGRALMVETGEVRITPATEALLWRGIGHESETTPPGETVALSPGDAIFLPALADAAVESAAPIGITNQGTEDAILDSFHTHQAGGLFWGFPQGLTLGHWDMAYSAAMEPFDDVAVLFRLTRLTGPPGAGIEVPGPPAIALYFVEAGTLEQSTTGPRGERVLEWPTGRQGYLTRIDGVEHELRVAGDVAATVLELSAVPEPERHAQVP